MFFYRYFVLFPGFEVERWRMWEAVALAWADELRNRRTQCKFIRGEWHLYTSVTSYLLKTPPGLYPCTLTNYLRSNWTLDFGVITSNSIWTSSQWTEISSSKTARFKQLSSYLRYFHLTLLTSFWRRTGADNDVRVAWNCILAYWQIYSSIAFTWCCKT